MFTLAAAYAVAWVTVVAYVGRMGIQNRRLALRLELLEASAAEKKTDWRESKAA